MSEKATNQMSTATEVETVLDFNDTRFSVMAGNLTATRGKVLIIQDLSAIPQRTLGRIIRACETELMERDDAWTELDAVNGEG